MTKVLTLFPFMKSVLGNHGTKYMPTTTLGEIKDTIAKLHNEVETCKKKYNALAEANSVMIEELQSVYKYFQIVSKNIIDSFFYW